MADWQPIETAPKDGTRFLAYYPAEYDCPPFIEVTSWEPVPHFINTNSWTIDGFDPTHWMPLPKPPQEASND